MLQPELRENHHLALVKETPKHKSTSSVYVSPWQRMRAITDVLRYHKAGSNSDSRHYDKRNP